MENLTVGTVSVEREEILREVRRARWGRSLRRACEAAGLLAILGYLIFDRVRLFQEFLSKYVDEDQAIEWYAAREALRGRFHEPCFYGQSYNSNLEGFLGAPLVAMHVPYEIALPLMTVFLGLFPFLLMAFVAWRRRQPLVAGLALLVPAAMSTRYGIITGMPRGFVTGIAVGIIPAILFLPPLRALKLKKTPSANPGAEFIAEEKTAAAERPRLRRGRPMLRYFFAGLLAVVAGMLNPNSVVLLLPVAVFAVITSFLEWRFWVFGILGGMVGGLYPLYVYYFYFKWHDDYRLYLREREFKWSYENFQKFVPQLDSAFRDLVPEPVYAQAESFSHWLHGIFPSAVPHWAAESPAAIALLLLFTSAFVLLVFRARVAAAFATLSGVGLAIFAMAYDRLQNARASVSFPYARMFLAVPVLLVWLLMLLKRPVPLARESPNVALPGWRRIARKWAPPAGSLALLALMIVAARSAALAKSRVLSGEVADLVGNADIARPVPLAEGRRIAAAINKIAGVEPVSFVLIVGYDGRRWDYLLPELTSCETLFPNFERRTWRLVEECAPRYDKILVLGNANSRARGHPMPGTRVSADPPLTLCPLRGQSVIDFCRTFHIGVRSFKAPAPVHAAK